MAYYVYLLKCADATLYCGYTNNLEKRLQSHNQGKDGAKYTRARRPVELVFVKRFYKLSNALRFEIQIKKLSRTEKQKLIDDFRKANLKKLQS